MNIYRYMYDSSPIWNTCCIFILSSVPLSLTRSHLTARLASLSAWVNSHSTAVCAVSDVMSRSRSAQEEAWQEQVRRAHRRAEKKAKEEAEASKEPSTWDKLTVLHGKLPPQVQRVPLPALVGGAGFVLLLLTYLLVLRPLYQSGLGSTLLLTGLVLFLSYLLVESGKRMNEMQREVAMLRNQMSTLTDTGKESSSEQQSHSSAQSHMQ